MSVLTIEYYKAGFFACDFQLEHGHMTTIHTLINVNNFIDGCGYFSPLRNFLDGCEQYFSSW